MKLTHLNLEKIKGLEIESEIYQGDLWRAVMTYNSVVVADFFGYNLDNIANYLVLLNFRYNLSGFRNYLEHLGVDPETSADYKAAVRDKRLLDKRVGPAILSKFWKILEHFGKSNLTPPKSVLE